MMVMECSVWIIVGSFISVCTKGTLVYIEAGSERSVPTFCLFIYLQRPPGKIQ